MKNGNLNVCVCLCEGKRNERRWWWKSAPEFLCVLTSCSVRVVGSLWLGLAWLLFENEKRQSPLPISKAKHVLDVYENRSARSIRSFLLIHANTSPLHLHPTPLPSPTSFFIYSFYFISFRLISVVFAFSPFRMLCASHAWYGPFTKRTAIGSPLPLLDWRRIVELNGFMSKCLERAICSIGRLNWFSSFLFATHSVDFQLSLPSLLLLLLLLKKGKNRNENLRAINTSSNDETDIEW